MARPLITLEYAQTHGAPNGVDEQDLTRKINAASAWIERWCQRHFAPVSEAADQIHSGERAHRIRDDESRCGSRLYLAAHDTGYYTAPVQSVGSVTEDGTAVTVITMPWSVTPSDTEYAALLDKRTGVLTRVSISGGELTPRAWASGFANIRVLEVQAGAASIDDVPDEIANSCAELVMIWYREGARAGIESINEGGGAATYSRLLMPETKRALESWSLRHGPRTLEG